MARHTKQNRFSGSGFHRQRGKQGGSKHVLERHVIGDNECWCGHTLCDADGNWEGKQFGAPHPQPTEILDEVEVTLRTSLRRSYLAGEISKEEYDDLRVMDYDDLAEVVVAASKYQEELEKDREMMTSEVVRITRGDMSSFSRETQDTLMYIVNECGVRWRAIDGSHLLLYPPDGESRPFKVSAARQDKVNRQILHEQFIRDFGLPPMPGSKKEAKAAAAEQAPEPVADTAPEPAPRPAEPKVAPEPTAVEIAPEIETEEPETPDLPEDFLGNVRTAIGLLTEALGEQSIEHEALVAMEENDRLRREVDRHKADKARAIAERDGLAREAEQWKTKAREFETLLDEAVEARDKAQSRWAALKAVLADD